MSPEEFRASGHQVVDWIADYLRDIRDLPVLPDVQPGELIDALPATGPEHGESMDVILADFRNLIVPGITHWNHPRFFAYFSISASGPGILGEMLAAALNVNHMLWKTSPAATELEQVTLGWLRQWLGLPDSYFGIIHDTASTGSLHAILAARELASPGVRLTGEHNPLVLYASEHAHSSIDRGALAAGIGLENVHHVPSDDQFRMRPDALATMIEADLAAGKKPFCVVATAGTTSATSVDSVAQIGEIARRYQLWFHVDAAYAGSAALLEEHRHILDGATQADSLVVNPHKWLFTPVDLSILYTRRPDVMRRMLSLEEAPPYLQAAEQDRAVNLSEYSLALGRRFRSLKLWFVLRYFGREGITRILRRHMEMARDLAQRISTDSRFELAAPVLFSLVCFRYRGSDQNNRDLLDRINASGRAFLSGTTLHGKFVLRLAIGNIATTEDDVRQTWEWIRSSALPATGSPAAEPPRPL
ncbi:MAG: aminotransferase class V-fold PLP-dependent enzyme [Acidobacteriia bacterium]|nr:aminotransferase class V-fold PLP-dependent enzyme [Terriglobia bacterium]